jgi:hypothetical protein
MLVSAWRRTVETLHSLGQARGEERQSYRGYQRTSSTFMRIEPYRILSVWSLTRRWKGSRAEEEAEARERFGRHAAVLVAILAAFLAVAALAAQKSSEQILLAQAQSTDAYNELEANSLKKHIDGDVATMLQILAPSNAEATKQAQALQEGVNNKYSVNEASLLENAKGLDELRDQEEQHHGWLQLAEGAFQLGIVLTSVAIIARAVALVWAGAVVGVVGLLLLVQGFTLVAPIS